MNEKHERYIELIKKVAQTMDECDLVTVNISESTGVNAYTNISLQKREAYGQFAGYGSFDAGSTDVINTTVTRPDLNTGTPSAPAFEASEEIKAPIVGVFYSAPSPEADPFVRIGDTVKKGDVLCILEAMKSMNEITAEHDGKIIDICVQNGDVVEFGQVLFKFAAE